MCKTTRGWKLLTHIHNQQPDCDIMLRLNYPLSTWCDWKCDTIKTAVSQQWLSTLLHNPHNYMQDRHGEYGCCTACELIFFLNFNETNQIRETANLWYMFLDTPSRLFSPQECSQLMVTTEQTEIICWSFSKCNCIKRDCTVLCHHRLYRLYIPILSAT